MNAIVYLASAWVVIASITAFMPMRYQIVPGSVLILSAPVLLYFLATQLGIWALLAGLFAFVSMFRKPLYYLTMRALGREVDRPDFKGRK